MTHEPISRGAQSKLQDDSSLFSLSTEFLEAARVLLSTPPTRIGYSSAIYYLLGHAGELALKAFLYRKGMTIPGLKKIRHDLEQLVTHARTHGLADTSPLHSLLQLAPVYKDKEFEYRTLRPKTFPDAEVLLTEIEGILSLAFDAISHSSQQSPHGAPDADR